MADDQTRKSFDDAEDGSGQAFEPAGEELGRPARAQLDGEIVDPEAEELTGEPVVDHTPGHADPEDIVIDDPQQLAEAEAAAARARSSRPVRRKRQAEQSVEQVEAPEPQAQSSEQAPTTEARPTVPRPVRRTAPEASTAVEQSSRRPKAAARSAQPAAAATTRTTPGVFVGQSVAELRKVIWPTSSQLSQYFIVVLLFVLFIVAYVGLLDPAFGWVLLKFLGK